MLMIVNAQLPLLMETMMIAARKMSILGVGRVTAMSLVHHLVMVTAVRETAIIAVAKERASKYQQVMVTVATMTAGAPGILLVMLKKPFPACGNHLRIKTLICNLSRVRVGQVNPAPKGQLTVPMIVHAPLLLLMEAVMTVEAMRKMDIVGVTMERTPKYLKVMMTVAAKKTAVPGILLAIIKKPFPAHENQPMIKAFICSL